MIVMEELLTVEEVAKRLHISKDTVWRWLRNKELTGVRIAGAWRIAPRDLQTYIDKQPKEKETK